MLSRPQPTFPNHLRNALVDATVRIAGRIGTDGRLVDPQVIESGHPDLAAAVEQTVGQWTWQEALLNCEPVEIGVTISVTFLLPNTQ
jgi:outer membrane biosynthesis protein TonB